jgi:hypothetical protein
MNIEAVKRFFHFFPARTMVIPVPLKLHRFLDAQAPFMIYANLVKPCAD